MGSFVVVVECILGHSNFFLVAFQHLKNFFNYHLFIHMSFDSANKYLFTSAIDQKTLF